MNLNKALKTKVKLVSKVNKSYARFSKSNSVQVGRTQHFNPEEEKKAWEEYTDQLIELKARIFVANQPIYSKILKLGELKSRVSLLNQVSTLDGEEDYVPRGGYGVNPVVRNYESFMTVTSRDKEIESIEEEIDTIQSEIEEFNIATIIEDIKTP